MTFRRSRARAYGLLGIVFLLGSTLLGAAPHALHSNAATSEQDQQTPAKTGRTKSSNGQQGGSRSAKKAREKKAGIHLQGVLIEGGAECQRFRASDNRYYTLEGDLHGFHTGDRVEISGNIPQVSHCMQDTPIHVQSIRKVQPRDAGSR